MPANTARQFSLGPVLSMESFSQGWEVEGKCGHSLCFPSVQPSPGRSTRVDISSSKHATVMGALQGHYAEKTFPWVSSQSPFAINHSFCLSASAGAMCIQGIALWNFGEVPKSNTTSESWTFKWPLGGIRFSRLLHFIPSSWKAVNKRAFKESILLEIWWALFQFQRSEMKADIWMLDSFSLLIHFKIQKWKGVYLGSKTST